MQSQGLEFDSMMDEDIFKTIQEEIEKEKNGSKLMNHYDLSLKGKFLEEADINENRREAKKKECKLLDDDLSVGTLDFEKEKKKRNNKPMKKAETSSILDKNEGSSIMEIDDDKDELKIDKKQKNKKKKEKDNDTTMLMEDGKNNSSNLSLIKESGDNDPPTKEEKKNKKKKNKETKNDCQDTNTKEIDEVMDDKFSKIKIEEIEKNDPKQVVLNYLITQNRPYSFINIFDNLRGAIKKSLLQKILDNLVDDSKIICKEYNSKIYLASQKNFPIIDNVEMKKIDDELEENNNKISEQKENISNLNTELKTILGKPTTEQIINKIRNFQGNIKGLESILLENEKKNIKMVDPELMKVAEKNFEEENLKFKKIKKTCIDIIDNFCECMEKNRNEIMTMIGLEDDIEMISTLKIKNI